MKIAVYQTNPVLLDVQANLENVIEKIHRAREKDARLVVFPELALTGYFVGHRYHQAALRLDSPEIQRLVAATRSTAAVVGFIEESPAMNFYNSALVAVDGRLLFAYRKLNLPNYGVFEERKIFSAGKRVPVFRLDDMILAIFICNDMWHPAGPYLGICQKADVFVTILNSAEESMGSEFSNIESWQIINKFYSRVFGIYNVAVNRVGEESIRDDETPPEDDAAHPGVSRRFRCRFWGGSELVNPFGLTEAKAAMYQEDELVGEISRDLLRKKRIVLPYLRADDPYFTHRELDRILYGRQNRLPGESS